MNKEQAKQEEQRIVKQSPLCFKIAFEERKSIAINKVKSNIDLLERVKLKISNTNAWDFISVDSRFELFDPINRELNNLKQIKAEIELL